jgi:hypothetical protein
VVDAQAVDGAVPDQLQHQRVGGVEDRRVLDPQSGEGVDREEPAVVEVGVRAAPVDQLVVLPGVHLLRRAALGAGRDREPVVVVAQLRWSVPIGPAGDHLELLDVVRRAEDGDADLVAAEGPVDVEVLGVGTGGPMPEHVPPPRCRRGVGDAHVVGHQVEDEAQPVLVQRGHEPVEALPSTARLVDVRVVDGVVAVVAALRRPQQGRGVRVRHTEIGQVTGHLGGVLQPEPGVHLQPVGGGRDAPAPVLLGNRRRLAH